MCRTLFFIFFITTIFSCNKAAETGGDGILDDIKCQAAETGEIIQCAAPPKLFCEDINEIAASENTPLEFPVPCSDLDSLNLTFQSDNRPEGAVLDSATGLLKWTPSYSQAGIHNFSLVVSDGVSNFEKEISINVSNVYLPMTLTQMIQTRLSIADEIYDFNGDKKLTTADLERIQYCSMYTCSHPYMDVNRSGRVTTGDALPLSDFLKNPDLSINYTRLVDLTRIYSSRQCFPDGNCEALVNESFKITLDVSGGEGLPLIYSALNLPVGSSFDPSTKTFSFKPTQVSLGDHSITFSVTDGITVSEKTILLSVIPDSRL
jgi:hypothetical protein